MSHYISVDRRSLGALGEEFERASQDRVSFINEAMARISLYNGVGSAANTYHHANGCAGGVVDDLNQYMHLKG